MTALLALVVCATVAAPHLLRREYLTPLTGVAVWLSVLALRALLALFAVAVFVLYVPATRLFDKVTHWCVHTVLPFAATHLGFSGHSLGDAATLVPGLFLAISVISAGYGIWRAARRVGRWLRTTFVGFGPRESIVVSGSEVFVAASGIRSPRVIVSAGALTELDDAELTASLEHERGHIVRHHRHLLLAGHLLFAIARPIPGSRRALAELRLHLERDADEYSVVRTGDPLALASAICKAAAGERLRPLRTSSLTLSGGEVGIRLRLLSDQTSPATGRLTALSARAIATVLAALTLGLTTLSPMVVETGIEELEHAQAEHVCPA